MTAVDPTYYSAGIAIILASIYVLKYTRFESILSTFPFYFPTWLSGVNGKSGLQHLAESTVVSPHEDTIPSPYSSRWWTDDKQFQLERRAIFSKTWMFVTHASRFQKPGDYRTFEIAGFSFIVILGKDKQLRTFHNVCRHRAYAVTRKESGSSTVLGCRYHGWSYDTRGKLIKAPEFENVAGFDKAMNGLWEMKSEVRESMVFVNFQVGGGGPELKLGESESMMKRWRIAEMKWTHEWKVEGTFNWKLAEETFLSKSSKKNEASYWKSILHSIFRVDENSVMLSHTTFVRRLPSGRFLILKFLPISTNETSVECNIYGRTSRHTKAMQLELDSTKKEVQLTIQRTERKHRELVHGVEETQNSSVQGELRRRLDSHSEDENSLGAEIHPAARKQSFTSEGIADDDLCKELEIGGQNAACGANTKGLLDW